MQKFENVDVIAALGEIMRQNTAFIRATLTLTRVLSSGPQPAIRPWTRPCCGCPGPLERTVSGNVTCF